jgi:hypothetical protein
MRWSAAVAGRDETGAADLEDLYCDPAVHSVFVVIVATWCTACPERMSQIAGLRDTWERYGARFIFLVSDASTASVASSYVDRYGITFGFRTNDADNSSGSGAITGSSIYSAVPWTGVIRTSDMVFVTNESESYYIDLEAEAASLAGE